MSIMDAPADVGRRWWMDYGLAYISARIMNHNDLLYVESITKLPAMNLPSKPIPPPSPQFYIDRDGIQRWPEWMKSKTVMLSTYTT